MALKTKQTCWVETGRGNNGAWVTEIDAIDEALHIIGGKPLISFWSACIFCIEESRYSRGCTSWSGVNKDCGGAKKYVVVVNNGPETALAEDDPL